MNVKRPKCNIILVFLVSFRFWRVYKRKTIKFIVKITQKISIEMNQSDKNILWLLQIYYSCANIASRVLETLPTTLPKTVPTSITGRDKNSKKNILSNISKLILERKRYEL